MMAVKDYIKTWTKQLRSLGRLICYILSCICLSHLTGLTQLLLCWRWEGGQRDKGSGNGLSSCGLLAQQGGGYPTIQMNL